MPTLYKGNWLSTHAVIYILNWYGAESMDDEDITHALIIFCSFIPSEIFQAIRYYSIDGDNGTWLRYTYFNSTGVVYYGGDQLKDNPVSTKAVDILENRQHHSLYSECESKSNSDVESVCEVDCGLQLDTTVDSLDS